MKHVPVRLGPMALLLTVVSICLSVLGVLTFSTSRADLALSERYAKTVQTRYHLEVQGQEFLETARPGESEVFEDDDMVLTVAVDENGKVSQWTMEKKWTQDNTIDNLWNGN